jgi:hypothetical protein
VGDWIIDCDCCKQKIKKIKNQDFTYTSYNLDDTEHKKHLKVWVVSIASFFHFDKTFEKLDPESNVGNLTIGELDSMIEFKLNLKFGQYYHGQSEFNEIWLPPKKFNYEGIDYFISGNIDGVENDVLVELKTTWVSSKTKMQGVIERAKTQADIYAWIGGYKEAKIIVKNMVKPELDETVAYRPDTSQVEEMIIAYIDENKNSIKEY